jgi:predicted alpha/beta hydrolase family esterase
VAAPPIVIVPGLGGSEPGHWQSHWQGVLGARRIAVASWDRPSRADWIRGLAAAAEVAPIVIAHSLGCLAVAHAAAAGVRFAAALLVAPVDVTRLSVLADFAPVPRGLLPFISIVVASDDDVLARHDHAVELARGWGSRMVTLEGAGHINAASGHDEWIEGIQLVGELTHALARKRITERIPTRPGTER